MKKHLQDFYVRKVSLGKMPINDKLFIATTNVSGMLIIPEDGSYLRFISNTWYDKETLTEVFNRPIMDNLKIEVFKYMEDYDNWGLDSEDRRDALEEAVAIYNAEHNTYHVPSQMFREYEAWRMKQDV